MNRWPWLFLALFGPALAGCGDQPGSETADDAAADGATTDGGTSDGAGADGGGGPGAAASGAAQALEGNWMLIADDRESYVTIKSGRLAIGDEDVDMGGPCTVTKREDGKYDVLVKYDDDILGGTEDTLVIQLDGDTITMFDKNGKAKGRYKRTADEDFE